MARPELRRPQDTKQVILLAAYAIVREEGIDYLSANKVAQKAGISKGGFFHHFPQVDDLYLYILDELMNSLQQSASQQNHPTFTSFIDYIAESLLSTYRTNPEIMPMLLHFFSVCQQKPAYLDRLHATSAQIFSAWSDQLGVYSDKGMSDESLDELTRLSDAFFLGFGIHNLLFNDPERYRVLAHHFGEMAEAFYFHK